MTSRTQAELAGAAHSAFLGRGGPATAGSDLMNSAIAIRSASDSCAVLRTTAVMLPPTLSKLGVKPVLSISAISDFDQFASPSACCVMFGTKPLPSGSGPPAKRVDGMIAPSALRLEWHSAQWPGARPSTEGRVRRYAKRSAKALGGISR